MRAIVFWAFVALVGVVGLQPAAQAKSILKDIGMGVSMKERLVAVPASITTISSVPTGLVTEGPVSYKVDSGSLVYRVLLGPNGHTTVHASGKAGNKAWTDSLMVGNYPLGWSPASVPALPTPPRRIAQAQVNSGTTMIASSPASQASGNASSHPSYGNIGGWCCNVELQLGQDLTGWNPLTNQLGGSTSAGSADIKGGVKIDDRWTLVGGLHTGYSKDGSWGWRDNVASNSVVAGPLVGLRFQADPSNQLELGMSYDFVLLGDPQLAATPVDMYASWYGDHGRWYHRARVATALPTSSSGARYEIGVRPLEQLPQLNVHAVAQGRQSSPPSGKGFDPARDLHGQWGAGLGFDVTDQVNAGIEILAPSKPGDNVSLGLTTNIHF